MPPQPLSKEDYVNAVVGCLMSYGKSPLLASKGEAERLTMMAALACEAVEAILSDADPALRERVALLFWDRLA